MKQEELNNLLKKCNLKLNEFDKMNGITIEEKTRWKIEEIIENEVKCPNCGNYRLTGFDPEKNFFICAKCENAYFEEDLIK